MLDPMLVFGHEIKACCYLFESWPLLPINLLELEICDTLFQLKTLWNTSNRVYLIFFRGMDILPVPFFISQSFHYLLKNGVPMIKIKFTW